MSKYTFAFGPDGGFFFATELSWSSQGLPGGLGESLHTDVQVSKQFVSLGANGQYFYSRSTPQKCFSSLQKDGDNTKIRAWFKEQKGVIQLSFGPDNTYIACTSSGSSRWSGDLPQNVQRSVKGFHPIVATLGVRGAFVLVNGEGKIKWNLKGRYDQLDQILAKSNLAIETVVLNPHAEEQYIIIFKNGTWRAYLPTMCIDKVKEMMQKQDEHDAQIIAMKHQANMQMLQTTQQLSMLRLQNTQFAMQSLQNQIALSNAVTLNACIW